MIKLTPYKNKQMNVVTEIGIDPDNNKFLFGLSSEAIFKDKSEIRYKKILKVDKVLGFYLRIWIFKTVISFFIDTKKKKKGKEAMLRFWKKKKNRNNFKIAFGRAGYKSNISKLKRQ